MRTLVFLALVGCGTSPSSTGPSPQLLLDCVGTWDATDVSLNLKGNHPDYEPDFGQLWPRGKEAQPLRYFADGTKLRLWLEHGKRVLETRFKLVTLEDSKFVTKYELRVDEPVGGAKVFVGAMAKSFRCEPRSD